MFGLTDKILAIAAGVGCIVLAGLLLVQTGALHKAERRADKAETILSTERAAWADELAPAPEIPQTLEQASAQRARAAAMRDEAERRHEAEKNACYSKFLVNDCLADAKKRYTATIVEARRLDQPARDFEREARRRDVEAEEAQRLADQPAREAEQKASAERFRAEEAAKASARQQKLAEKARQAEEGRQKTAAEQARRQAKLEKRARQDAEREAKKAARQAGSPAAGAGN